MDRWKSTFVAAFVAQILTLIGFAFAMPFLPFFIEELGVTDKADQAWWAGIVLASSGITFALFSPVWGALADRYGRKLMLLRAMLAGTVVLVLISMVQTVGQLVICRLLQGAFTGTIAASVALVASVTPARRSGFVLGMMQAAVFVGMTLGPLFGGFVADHWGYRVAFRAGAAIVFVGSLLVYVGIHEEKIVPHVDAPPPPRFAQLMTSGVFVLAVLVLFGVRFSNTLTNPSFPLIVKDILILPDRTNSLTGGIIACAGIAGAVSAALTGHFGDRWGHQRVLIGCSLGTAAACAGHAMAYSIPVLVAMRLLFGLAIAGSLPAANAMIRDITDQRHIGKAFGIATSLGMAGIAVGPLLGGWLAREAGLRVPFVAAGIAQLAVAVVVILATRNRRGKRAPQL